MAHVGVLQQDRVQSGAEKSSAIRTKRRLVGTFRYVSAVKRLSAAVCLANAQADCENRARRT